MVVTELRQKRDEKRKARTRQKLLEAAGRVFVKQGYHRPLISDFVSEAGVGQGTFYRHFENKRAIFGALFAVFTERLLAGFASSVPTLPKDLEEYRELSVRGARQAVGVLQEQRDLTLLFLREGPSVDQSFRDQLEALNDQMAALAELYLRHAMEQGFIGPCDAMLVSHAIVGQAQRILTLWLDGRLADRSPEHIVGEMVKLAMRGYASPSGLVDGRD